MNRTIVCWGIFMMLILGLAFTVSLTAEPSKGETQKAETHTEWVSKSLLQMRTVRVGMNRADLLKVFTTEGGLSTPTQRTYVYRECPYFKVDVTFKIVGRPERDKDGGLTSTESPHDTIKSISQPYIEYSIMD